MSRRPQLLILGASTRAAAHSAVRAGLRPICGDLFADEDLRAVADVLPVANSPCALAAAASHAPRCPWMYTGALENHPRMIAHISAERPLWGNRADVVSRVRDPFRVHALLAGAGLPAPAIRPAVDPPRRDGRWMLKPRRSAAGRGIRIWNETAATAKTLGEPHYFQRKMGGMPISALFLATAQTARLIGISRQLVGETWLHAAPFQYCGSIGPIRVGPDAERQIQRSGAVLAEQTRLRGLFGCDYVYDGDDAWLVEINPRYTASVEVFEHAHGIPLLGWHCRACAMSECREKRKSTVPAEERFSPSIEQMHRERPGQIVGKAILYADRETAVPAPGLEEKHLGRPFSDKGIPRLADIPPAGSVIRAGHPLCTVLANGPGASDCLAALRETVRRLEEAIGIRQTAGGGP